MRSRLISLSDPVAAGNVHAKLSGVASPTNDVDRSSLVGMQGFSGRSEQPSGVLGYRPPYQEPTPQSGQENEPQGGVSSAALIESPPLQQQPPNQRPATQKRLAEMTDMERWGMPGLLALFNREHPDFTEMAAGFDLTTFGLDLRSAHRLVVFDIY